MSKKVVALAGQPNSGKSTVFNALTGAKQFVANYPGVTVDKMMGWYKRKGATVEVVDLPGIYSLTSYSPEERVSRDFLLHEKPSVVINVLDGANLKRSLYLTFQLLEMEVPMVMDLNMMDVAEREGFSIDTSGLSKELGVPVVATVMTSGRGKEELMAAVDLVSVHGKEVVRPPVVEYPELEGPLASLEEALAGVEELSEGYPPRWLALKLLENDKEAFAILEERGGEKGAVIAASAKALRKEFEERYGDESHVYIAQQRYGRAAELLSRHVRRQRREGPSLTSRIDSVVCHKIGGPLILLGIIYLLYVLAIVQGYRITTYTWPILAGFRNAVSSVLPPEGFIEIPLLRAFVLWFIDSMNALLNYIPIFFILFSLIAFLEDSGYMPRMAFIMDRALHRFGLHGQSTLPMVLGGVIVGGCAVPAVMSCKGMPDEKSRLATILTIPLLNCLAKVPLYILLINTYFTARKETTLFFISTVSLLIMLPVAKILSITVLKDRPTAPFIMEMPPYHIPTFRGVFGRAVERIWLYIRKITTVVAAVAVILFALLQFPGLSKETTAFYEGRAHEAVRTFLEAVEGNPLAASVTAERVMDLVRFSDAVRSARMSGKPLDELERSNPDFFAMVQGRGKPEARKASQALKVLMAERQEMMHEMRQIRIENSILGTIGKRLEPVTRFAGFNWRVNIAVLSALAAKESTVATLGSLYQQDGAAEDAPLEERMESQEVNFTPLHALALMLFMVVCPPCIPTAVAVRVQTGSTKWMLFSFLYQLFLGLFVAMIVFTGGQALGLSGIQAMWGFYGLALALTVVMGFVKPGHVDGRAMGGER